jgi:hypothetical protein
MIHGRTEQLTDRMSYNSNSFFTLQPGLALASFTNVTIRNKSTAVQSKYYLVTYVRFRISV